MAKTTTVSKRVRWKPPTVRHTPHHLSAEEIAEAQKLFVKGFSRTGILRDGYVMAGVSQTTVRKWLKKDPKFAARVQRARDVADDRIRQELHRRAVIGVKEGVWFKGRLVGHQKKYSDRLLQLLAASRFPEFRQKTELTGEGGGPLTIKVVYDQEVDKDVPPEDVVDGEYRSLT